MAELRYLLRVIGPLHIIGLCSHACVTHLSALCCARGVAWATHSLLTEGSTGVLWVWTGTHPCGPPPRQDGGGTRAPALRTLDDVLRFQGDVDFRRVLLHIIKSNSSKPEKSFLVIDFGLMRSFSELVASISWSTAIRARDSSLLRKLLLENSRSSFEIPFSQGIFADASPRRDNSELSCHLSTSPNTQDMVSHRHKTYLSSTLFLLALTEKQRKSIELQWSSLPLFSIPSLLRILDIISDSWWCCQISWIIVKN